MKNEEIIKELEKKRHQLIKEFEINISAISSTIQILKNESEQQKVFIEGLSNQSVNYEDNTDYLKLKGKLIADSILNVITYKKRFLHNSEITEVLTKIYIGRDKNKFSRQISGLLSNLKKKKKIVSFAENTSQKGIYWGYDKWLRNDKIIEGFEYYKK
jgi:hypothetical protein